MIVDLDKPLTGGLLPLPLFEMELYIYIKVALVSEYISEKNI